MDDFIVLRKNNFDEWYMIPKSKVKEFDKFNNTCQNADDFELFIKDIINDKEVR